MALKRFECKYSPTAKGDVGAGKLDPMSKLGVEELSYAMADIDR